MPLDPKDFPVFAPDITELIVVVVTMGLAFILLLLLWTGAIRFIIWLPLNVLWGFLSSVVNLAVTAL